VCVRARFHLCVCVRACVLSEQNKILKPMDTFVRFLTYSNHISTILTINLQTSSLRTHANLNFRATANDTSSRNPCISALIIYIYTWLAILTSWLALYAKAEFSHSALQAPWCESTQQIYIITVVSPRTLPQRGGQTSSKRPAQIPSATSVSCMGTLSATCPCAQVCDCA